MLNEVKPLISSEDNEEAMLGVSSLVNAYCKKNECENDIDIASIVSSIEDKIGVGCYVDKNNLGKVILSLRSLGNAGFVNNAIRTITNCMIKRDNPTEVRLSAIQAFRRMPCSISFDTESDSLKGDLYMRVFGNELLFTRFTGLSDVTDGKPINILDILTTLAKKQEYSFTQSYVFLDSSVIIPTMAGFPLNLTIDGSATVDLRASGKMDLTKITDRSPSLSLNGYMKPSGAVQINSMMSVDAFVTKSGMKMISTMHSSSSLEGHVELANGKVLSAQIKTPFDKMEVFNVKTAFFTVHREVEREQKMITANRQTKKMCSGNKLAKITGLELCAELQYPNASLIADAPYFPMTGPVSAGITLLKRDTHESYNMEYKFVKDKQEARARVAFSTPGSTVDRELSFDCLLRSDPLLEISMISPWKRVSIRALVGENKQKQVAGRIVIDDKDEYSVTGEWIRKREGQLYTYNPYIEIIIPNMENIRLSSSLESLAFKKNNDYNVVINTDMNNKQRLTKVNFDLKYGAKPKDENKRIFVTSLVRHELGLKKSDIDITGDIRHLALGLDLKLKGKHSHNTKSIVSNFGLAYGKKQSVSAALVVKNKSKKFTALTGDVSLKWNDKDFSIANNFEQKNKRRYTNELISNIAGHKTKVVSDLKLSDEEYDVSTDISMSGQKPIHLEALLNLDPRNFRVKSRLNNDYSAEFGSQYKKAALLRLSGDVSVPSRRVKGEFEAKKKDPIYVGHLDIQWDANVDKEKQIFLDTQLTYKTKNEIDAVLVFKSPLQNNKININRKNENAHCDIKSDGKEQLSVDASLKQKYGKDQVQIDGSLTVHTAVKGLSYVKLGMNHLSEPRQYKTNFDVNWKPDNQISAAFSLKKPFSIRQFQGSLNLKTPLKGFKTSFLEISHDAKDSLKSFVNVQVNKNSLQFDASAKKENNIYSGHAGVKSNIRSIQAVSLDLSHQSRDKTNENSLVLNINGNEYRYEGKLTHDRAGLMVQQSGKITLSSPTSRYDSTWQHSNTLNDVTTVITTNMNGQQYAFNIKGRHNLAWKEASIQYTLTSATPFGKGQLMVSHLHKDSSMDTILSMSQNSKNLFTSEGHLKTENGELIATGNLLLKGEQMVALEGRLKTGSQKYVLITLSTPFKSFRRLRTEMEFEGNMKSMTSSVSFELQPIVRRIRLLSTFNRIGGVSGNVRLETQYQQLPSSEITFSNRPENDKSRTDIKVEYLPGKIVSLTSRTLLDGQKLSADVSIATPFEKLQRLTASITHDPTVKGCITEVEMEYPEGKSYYAELVVEYRENYHSSVTIRLPNYHPVTASLSHKGTWNQFLSGASLQYDRNGKHQLDISFHNGKSLQGSFTMKSSLVEDTFASFSHSGNRKSINSNILLKYGKNKPINVDIEMTNSKRMKGTLKVVSPIMDDITVLLVHKGKSTSFKTKAKIGWGKKEEIEGDLTFNFIKNLKTDISISTPFKSIRKMSAFVSHEGNLRNFKCQAEFKIGKNVWGANVKSNVDPTLSTELTVNTPHDGYEKMRASYTHNGQLSDFKCHLEVTKNKKDIIGDLQFSSQPLVLSATLQTPVKRYGNLKALLSHVGPLSNFQTKAEITYSDSKTISLDTSVSTNDRLTVSVDIKTPFKEYGEMTAKLSHSGTSNNFASRLETLLQRKRSQLDISFSSLGTLHNFISHGEIGYNGRKQHEANIELQNRDNRVFVEMSYNTKGRMSTPLTEDIEIFLDHQGTSTDFRSQASATYSGSKQHEFVSTFKRSGTLRQFQVSGEVQYNNKRTALTVDIDTTSKLSANMALQSPISKDIQLEVSLDGEFKNFNTKAELQYGDEKHELLADFNLNGEIRNFAANGKTAYNGKELSIDISADTRKDVDGKATLKLPYFDDIIVIIKKSGNIFDFNWDSQAELSYSGLKQHEVTASMKQTKSDEQLKSFSLFKYNRKALSSDISIDLTNGLDMNIDIQLPFRNMKASVSHELQGTLNNFHSNIKLTLNDKEIKAKTNLDIASGLEITLETPFTEYERNKVSLTFSNVQSLISGKAVAQIGKHKTQLNGKVDTSTGLKIELCLKTPLTEDFEVIINGNGDLHAFRYESSVSYGKEGVRGEVNHEWSSIAIKGNMLLLTPIIEDIKIEYGVNGNLKSFGTTVKASIGNMNAIEEVTRVRLGEMFVDFDATLKTTLSGNVKLSELRISHDGYISSFKTNIEAKYDDQTIKADASFKHLPSIEGSLSFQTPFEKLKDVNIKIEHSGSLKSFTTIGSLQYAPDKKMEGNARFTMYRPESLYLNVDLQTPLTAIPHLNGRYRHDLKATSLISSAYLTLSENNPLINGNLKITQEMIDISLNTPQSRYSVNADMKTQGDTYSLSGNAANGGKKITLAMEKTLSSFSINLETPIRGYKRTQVKASASRKPYHAALNIQTSYLPEIDFDARLTGNRFDELDGSLTLKTGLNNLRNIRMSMKNEKNLGELKSHIEAFFTERNGITIDASLTKTDSSLSVSTPWESLRTAYGYVKYDWRSQTNHLIVATNMKINKETLYDVDFEMDAEKREEITLIINVNEPRLMRFEINKLFSSETYMLVNWNKLDRDSRCRMDITYNSDWSDRKQIASYRGVCGSKSYAIGASYHRPDDSSKIVLFIEKDDVRTHGFETIHENNGQEKYTLQLPSRTVVLSTVSSSGYGISSQVFDFSWDAERDQNKRVAMRTTKNTRTNGDELTLGLEMPSLGKDIQLDYKMLIGYGNVIYDGRTAFRYSKDSRKTFTLSSKLEDVSGRGEDYKFLLGISHPYTTVDIQTKAIFGKSDDKLSAGFDIQYLTARRQTKNIALITEIDKLKRQLNIQVLSPIKTMKMDASVETSPFKLTIKNLYDDTKPINTELTVDPNDSSLDFNMNYDIKNPDNTLHVNAKFSDEKGISAELYRNVNQKKTVDSLLNLRLKTSKILHTRVHWRPSIISDLKAELTKRIEEYGIRSGMAIEASSDEINKEILYKRRLFQASYAEEVKSYADAINDKLSELRTLKADNAFYLQDICNSVDTTMTRIGEFAEDCNEAWGRWPVKHKIGEYMNSLEQLQQRLDAYSKDTYINMGGQLNSITTNSYQRLLDYKNSVGNHQTVVNLKSKYNTYMDQLKNMKLNEQWSSIANQYTSSIYNIREGINQRLVNSLPTPMYNMGSSAYKYWEFEENVNALVDKIFEELKKDATKEMSVLKEVFGNVLKSKVIKYDIPNGEIIVDFYLPVDVRTLSSLKDISLRQYFPDMSFQTPKLNFFGSLEDYMPHMTWTVSAKVHGRHFTTFDGQEFDFSGRCSYVLARDYVDGNFSIIMNYLGRQKKKLILTSHQQNVQLSPNGKVSVDGVVMDLPYRSTEFAVFSVDGKVFIEGRGFQVKSDPTVDMVDIDLSKWYFGKTGGLLGTLNHERYDDMIMPNNQITSDAFALGNAWQVQDRC
ncbi:uncharacterized protein LOC127737090 [Mytilus californianus]|uniref:uncharacterized protein LOC127737090 n=1 Tax=Mytilus californianus TaxID=6549 RepID=UPI00224841B0|nr:uncharacterized protein LOC127737090 [Mytilus californianus]